MSTELSQPKQILASTWLQDEFLGHNEEALLADPARFLDTSGAVLGFRHADQSDRYWRAGRFECMSITKLEAEVWAMPGPRPQSTGVRLTTADGIDIGK